MLVVTLIIENKWYRNCYISEVKLIMNSVKIPKPTPKLKYLNGFFLIKCSKFHKEAKISNYQKGKCTLDSLKF